MLYTEKLISYNVHLKAWCITIRSKKYWCRLTVLGGGEHLGREWRGTQGDCEGEEGDHHPRLNPHHSSGRTPRTLPPLSAASWWSHCRGLWHVVVFKKCYLNLHFNPQTLCFLMWHFFLICNVFYLNFLMHNSGVWRYLYPRNGQGHEECPWERCPRGREPDGIPGQFPWGQSAKTY